LSVVEKEDQARDGMGMRGLTRPDRRKKE